MKYIIYSTQKSKVKIQKNIFAEVVEWQTRISQKDMSVKLMRVRLSPSAPVEEMRLKEENLFSFFQF